MLCASELRSGIQMIVFERLLTEVLKDNVTDSAALNTGEAGDICSLLF